MGFRYRRSKKILPGVRLNLNKNSASISIGPKGLKHTISTTGRKTSTVGVPGTGMSYSSTRSNRQVDVTPTNNFNRYEVDSIPIAKPLILWIVGLFAAVWFLFELYDVLTQVKSVGGSSVLLYGIVSIVAITWGTRDFLKKKRRQKVQIKILTEEIQLQQRIAHLEEISEIRNFRLANVDGVNEDGTDRQEILRKYAAHEMPYDKTREVSYVESNDSEKVGCEFQINGLKVGDVPADTVSAFLSIKELIISGFDLSVEDRKGNRKGVDCMVSFRALKS